MSAREPGLQRQQEVLPLPVVASHSEMQQRQHSRQEQQQQQQEPTDAQPQASPLVHEQMPVAQQQIQQRGVQQAEVPVPHHMFMDRLRASLLLPRLASLYAPDTAAAGSPLAAAAAAAAGATATNFLLPLLRRISEVGGSHGEVAI